MEALLTRSGDERGERERKEEGGRKEGREEDSCRYTPGPRNPRSSRGASSKDAKGRVGEGSRGRKGVEAGSIDREKQAAIAEAERLLRTGTREEQEEVIRRFSGPILRYAFEQERKARTPAGRAEQEVNERKWIEAEKERVRGDGVQGLWKAWGRMSGELLDVWWAYNSQSNLKPTFHHRECTGARTHPLVPPSLREQLREQAW